MLGRRALTRHELISRLVRLGADPLEAEDTAREMQSLGYIDDAKLAQQVVENRARLKPLGRDRLWREMVGRGMERDMVRQTVDRLISPEIEVALAEKTAQKALGRWVREPVEILERKLGAFLARRGFSGETIARVIKKLGPGSPDAP